ncbi:glycosyltransferase family 2 protein [Stutzerimonas nitrititolerans]|uniref:glycosyltransferase family 2 protein n=1 Tax=Stutzerimonas nitrititolerans TaxID=2482751 RepID=UPI0028A8F2F7|nr:glycosyltransferase family 2 protein [Stutzerimonas nitrititolerans]
MVERPTDGPLLSIVVLVYNTAEYLHECFDSLLTQRYKNIEVIAVDDASTDDSLAICREYEAKDARFRCVARPVNQGGAVAGNQGVQLARGEYVALVDSDDIVTPDGYWRLMAEATSESADIVIGRAARLTDGAISAVAFLYEPFVWSRRRVVESVHEFPDVIHDCFYWNKVFRREFLIDNSLGMVPGLLYADRPFVHKAYFLSQKTVICTELVYLWRVRSGCSLVSISQNNVNNDNFIDRIRSMMIEWEDCSEIPDAAYYRERVAVANAQRALHVVPSIVASPSFRKVFVEGMQKLLSLYGNLDFKALGVRRQLYLRLLRLGEIEGLCYLLGLPVQGQMVELDGNCYWKQPFLDNAELGIERDLVRLEFPVIGFFHLCGLALEGDSLQLDLALPDTVMKHCEVDFEMLSLFGEGAIPLVSLGREAATVYRFSLRLSEDVLSASGSALYGLILNYRSGDVEGRYRIGWSLLSAEAQAALPLALGNGWQLLYSLEAGGLAMQRA